MRTKWFLPLSLPLVLLACGCGSGSSGDGRDAAANRAVPRTTPAGDRTPAGATSFVASGPTPTIGTPYCDAAQHCTFPGTQTLKLTGDWTGDFIQGSAAVTQMPQGRFASAAINIFVGSIAGCGTGTAVVRLWETGALSPATGTGRWEVVGGFGSGGLASLRGHGTGEGGIENGVRSSTQTGRVTCDRS